MSRYYIKKAKLQLAVTTLINTDWDNPHTYMQNTTASDFAKHNKNSDSTPLQLNLSFGTRHWDRLIRRMGIPEFKSLFWLYFDKPKKEKLKLKTASLDVWKKIYIEREEINKKNDEKYAIRWTFGGKNE